MNDANMSTQLQSPVAGRNGELRERVAVTVVGGPTAILEIVGLRLLTDPTFDEPGTYPVGKRSLVKTQPAALSATQVGAVDAVLLSHDQHVDNLDRAGRQFLTSCPLALSTPSAVRRLAGATRTLPAWSHIEIVGRDGRRLRITAVPAQHGPDGTEHLTGEVTGFVLSGQGLPTVYISGDNASLDIVRAVAARFPTIDVALIFAGATRTPLLEAYLTLTSAQAAEAAQILDAERVIPLHVAGWDHFTQGPDTLAPAFARAGIRDRLVLPEGGLGDLRLMKTR